MTNIRAPRLKEKSFSIFLGILIFTLASYVVPQSALAQATHDGKFSVAASSNARTTVYINATAGTQTVLVTVCVTTAGTQTAAIQRLDSLGAVAETLTNVKFGTCRSVSVTLATDEVISVKSNTSGVAFTGTYLISVQLS